MLEELGGLSDSGLNYFPGLNHKGFPVFTLDDYERAHLEYFKDQEENKDRDKLTGI